jgi:hypothetical protein
MTLCIEIQLLQIQIWVQILCRTSNAGGGAEKRPSNQRPENYFGLEIKYFWELIF